MKSTELINGYLSFFEAKGHAIIPSSPLIPENDPTVSFTTAGMHPLVPFLLGDPHPKDEEAARIWRRLGVPENHIFFLGKKDNWWGPAGKTGPCGPDSEMFYWNSEEKPKRGQDPSNCNKFLEIWNDVFMQYNKR